MPGAYIYGWCDDPAGWVKILVNEAGKLIIDPESLAHESTHVAGGSDDIDSALALAAMADLTNTKIWQGNAANRPVEVDPPAGEAPTKEFFVPVLHQTGAALSPDGTYGVWKMESAGDVLRFSFKIPHDFSSVTSVLIVGMCPGFNADFDWTATTSFAAVGETKLTHTDSATADGKTATANFIMSVDISAAFTGILADDYVGVQFKLDVVTGAGIFAFGLIFKYA